MELTSLNNKEIKKLINIDRLFVINEGVTVDGAIHLSQKGQKKYLLQDTFVRGEIDKSLSRINRELAKIETLQDYKYFICHLPSEMDMLKFYVNYPNSWNMNSPVIRRNVITHLFELIKRHREFLPSEEHIDEIITYLEKKEFLTAKEEIREFVKSLHLKNIFKINRDKQPNYYINTYKNLTKTAANTLIKELNNYKNDKRVIQ